MRAVVQRVTQASVEVDGQIVGEIGNGLVALIGVQAGDTDADVKYIATKTVGLRVFDDDAGRMNRNVLQAGGAILAISQFTLLGDVRRGLRPSFTAAAPPEEAHRIYQQVCDAMRELGCRVAEGVFRADMQVSLVNDGPVTILLDSRKTF